MSLRKFEIHFDEEKVKAYGKYEMCRQMAVIS